MSVGAWNRHCVGSNFTSVTYLVNGGTKLNLP